MSALAEALLAFQKTAPAIQRDALNPHFKNKYVSLETLMSEVVPKLNDAGLVVSQFPTTVENGTGPAPALRTRITHAESGEFVEDVMLLMPGKQDPQGQGSALTYARRYSLMAVLGLVADEDDDGNRASSAAGQGAGGTTSSSSAADNPAERAQAAYERTGGRSTPFSKNRPDMTEEEYEHLYTQALSSDFAGDQVCHFGANKGVLLKEMTPAQVKWYATEWKLQDTPSEYDHRLKTAAIVLHTGEQTAPFNLPFE